MISRRFVIVSLVFLLPVTVLFTVNGGVVSASGCGVQVGSFITGSYYSYPNIALIVPLVAQCSFSGGELSAVGNAYDTSNNANLGSSNAVLLSASGSSIDSGQLVFTLSSNEEWHRARVSVTVYNLSNPGVPLVGTIEIAAIDPNTKYVTYSSCYYGNACNEPYSYCQSPGNNSTVQCVGYIDENQNGCLELVIPIYSPYGFLSYQYYTLQNLSSSPPIGTWVTVTGQLHLGYNTTPSGGACPGNYLTVDSLSP
jgi:hypothetical protein